MTAVSATVVGHGGYRTLRLVVTELLQTVVGRHRLLRHRQQTIAVFNSQPRDGCCVVLLVRAARLLPLWQSLRLSVDRRGHRVGLGAPVDSFTGRSGRLVHGVFSYRARRRGHVPGRGTPSRRQVQKCRRQDAASHRRHRVSLLAHLLR